MSDAAYGLWPLVFPTLLMFPVLVYVYVRLARADEHEVATSFGQEWAAYADRTPSFLPSLRSEPRIPAGTP